MRAFTQAMRAGVQHASARLRPHAGSRSWGAARPTAWRYAAASVALPLVAAIALQSSRSRLPVNALFSDSLSGVSAANEPAWVVLPVAGDGRCMFRSLAKVAALRRGAPLSGADELRQADELRAAAMRELRARRAELEWTLDAEFESYVSALSQPRAWGGEPELLLCSHVLRAPISVAMRQRDGSLRFISTYGEEYGGTPLHVLFHGAGHYEGLVGPEEAQAPRARL